MEVTAFALSTVMVSSVTATDKEPPLLVEKEMLLPTFDGLKMLLHMLSEYINCRDIIPLVMLCRKLFLDTFGLSGVN